MTTVARRDPADKAKIDKLGTSTTDAYLGYHSGDRGAKAAAGVDNYRNGTRDRAGTYIPTMVPKGSRRLTDVDGIKHILGLWIAKE
ncbi:hypothetical protein Q5532_11675, partial [Corynebacterium diphtheriae]